MKKVLLVVVVLMVVICGIGFFGLKNMMPKRINLNTLPQSDVIHTANGDIQGRVGEKSVTFNGIPFAAAPIGDLRWRAPKPVTKWDGVLDATDFGAACMQPQDKIGIAHAITHFEDHGAIKEKIIYAALGAMPFEGISEDCLFLNIRVPHMKPVDDPLPVMIWIHGGSHKTGSAANPLYQADGLTNNGVILVTINYRLGVFGYMAHPLLSAESLGETGHDASGNYGLMDQIAAIKWVQDNIAAFGGDANNITIFGESAGGQAVSEIMASPLSNGIFHKAIMQSGVYSWQTQELKAKDVKPADQHELRMNLPNYAAEQYGSFLMVEMGKPAEISLAEMRKIPAADFIAHLRHSKLDGQFMPIRDGYVLPKHVGHAILDGDMPQIPILLGYNGNEGALMHMAYRSPSRHIVTGDAPKIKEDFAKYAGAQTAALRELYGMDIPKAEIASQGEIDILGDDLYGSHTRLMAKIHSQFGNDVYLYMFDRQSPRGGAYHAAEIPFVFQSPTTIHHWDKNDRALSKMMSAYWANFAQTGTPHEGSNLYKKTMAWPKYDNQNDIWMGFGVGEDKHIILLEHPRKDKHDHLEAILIRRLAESR